MTIWHKIRIYRYWTIGAKRVQKTAKTPAVMRKKGYKPVPVGIKNAPRSWGERVIIPQSAALTAPNRCPSPLSLCDISPHCGESPFTNRNKKTLEFYYKKQKEKELCKDLLQTKEQVSDTNSSEITIIPA